MAIAMGGDPDQPMMEMNTTPLIDVMLVLLIMFIITIPPQTHAVKIDLPTPSNDPAPEVDPIKNKLTIDEANTLAWNGTPINLQQLADYLAQTKQFPVEPELQFQPHPEADYIVVDRALAVIKQEGVNKLGFVGNEQYGRVF
ncbi:MAG: biopolymer transporter ExbD [Sphingomonadales bacterium]|nr:biopolymer transporter ExbD [Sphingomonadales bacterium]